MKELKRLQVKFVVSTMVMVSLIIGLAFLAIGYVAKTMVEQSAVPFPASAEPQNAREYFSPDREARLPYFILITDGDQEVIGVEGQYRLEAEDEFLSLLALESLSAAEDEGVLERYQLQYSRRPVGGGYQITYVDASVGNAYKDHMWSVLGLTGAAVWAAFFVISCLLSRWVVAPVGASMRREKQFVAGASHELKTPLTVIMANSQLLEENGKEASDEDRRRWIINIRQEASDMKHLVEEMLTLARNESSVHTEGRELCCLSDIVTESALSFESVFYQSGKELVSQVDEDVYMKGDEKQLHQLLKILLENAWKYSPDGSRSSIELARSGKKKTRLSISNPGEPISQKEQKLVFDRFYRADGSRSDGKGYGLGLAIAKTIAEKHKARIQVESSGGINRFSVEFHTVFHAEKTL